MRAFLIALFVSLISSTALFAADVPAGSFITAATLQRECDIKSDVCFAFLYGFNDGITARGAGWSPIACPNIGVSAEMVRLSFLRVMAAFPANQIAANANLPASNVVAAAMATDFPCTK